MNPRQTNANALQAPEVLVLEGEWVARDDVRPALPPAGEVPGVKSRGVMRRPMTAEETVAVLQLGTQVTYTPGSWDKKFARDLYRRAYGDCYISEKEAAQVWRLFKRYRRQIKHEWKERLLALAQERAAPEWRKGKPVGQ